MTPKTTLSIAAAVPFIFELAFVLAPEFFVLKGYPATEGLALMIATGTLAALCFWSRSKLS